MEVGGLYYVCIGLGGELELRGEERMVCENRLKQFPNFRSVHIYLNGERGVEFFYASS